MRLGDRLTIRIALCGVAALLVGTAVPSAQQAPAPGRGGFGGFVQSKDPRVQNRTYKFADTNEDMPYCVFVSSKVSKDKKNPLVMSLHGLGIGPGFMCQGKALDLAEEGGYIFVAPMGYSPGGWWGSPVMQGRGRAGQPPPPPPPANLAEMSERDTMHVLEIMRKEFNVDENRTYLMGHSMGGAGTYFLGSKHAKQWAALAPIAPAAFLMNNNRAAILQGIKDASLPMFVTTGDADEAVPVSNTRMWAETMKEIKMNHEYKEYPGVTHGPIIEAAMPDIFSFFSKHTRAGR